MNTYYCFFEDHEEEADATEMIGYFDMESAACSHAEDWDNGDYTIARGTEEIVVVKDEAGNRKRFNIRAEQSLDYLATELDEEPQN